MTTIENIKRGGPAAFGPHSARVGESGADELRRIVRVLGCCRESALDPFTLEELVKLQRAAWASVWDVYVDDLNEDQRNAALLLGEPPAFLDGPRGLEAVPSSLMPAADVHEWLCHGGPFDPEEVGCGDGGWQCSAEPDEARAAALTEAQSARRAVRG